MTLLKSDDFLNAKNNNFLFAEAAELLKTEETEDEPEEDHVEVRRKRETFNDEERKIAGVSVIRISIINLIENVISIYIWVKVNNR